MTPGRTSAGGAPPVVPQDLERLVVVGALVRDPGGRGERVPRADQAPGPVVTTGGRGDGPAFVAAHLGAPVEMLGAVGDDDAGVAILCELWAAGVGTDGVSVVPGATTGRSGHVVGDGGEGRDVAEPGIAAAYVPDQVVVAGMCDPRTTLLLSTTLSADAVRSAVRAAQNAGATVVVDAAGPAETTRLVLRDADVLHGDAEGIRALTGVDVVGADAAVRAARALLDEGPGLVVVDAGAHGLAVVGDEDCVVVPRPPIDVVDATGAGDALLTTLVVLLAAGHDLEHAGRLAAAAAAHTAGHLGGRPTFSGLDELERLAGGATRGGGVDGRA
jgi:ribokinase